MIPLQILMNGDGAFEELTQGKAVDDGLMTAITLLPGGMASGKPSIAIAVDVPGDDPRLVVAQTSWALLHAAVRAFEARYGAPA